MSSATVPGQRCTALKGISALAKPEFNPGLRDRTTQFQILTLHHYVTLGKLFDHAEYFRVCIRLMKIITIIMCVTDTVGLGYYVLVKCLEEPQMKGKLGEGRLIKRHVHPK